MRPDMLPFRFFVLTCRDSATDFRLSLAESLRRNHETYYIWLKRRPELTTPDGRKATLSFPALLAFLRQQKPNGKINVFFNSTNTSFPFVTAVMRLILPPSLWCIDMHDDLRYHYKGFALLRSIIGIKVMQLFSDVIVHAAPTLRELFPSSHHLGNASHILPVAHDKAEKDAVLILASLDYRFDFGLMAETAKKCPDLTFHIYGQISENNPEIKGRLDQLVQDHANIQSHGTYALNDLPTILQRYRVTFAPYIVGIDLTHYIDPLRFYHCLNAGLRLVTTAIPQALFMKDNLTIIGSGEDAAIALHSNASVTNYKPITWQQRADELATLLKKLPATERLGRSISTR